jgi:hypothetical protein
MRFSASLVYRSFVLSTLGGALLLACGGGASKGDGDDETGGASGTSGTPSNGGSGGASVGGTSDGGTSSGSAGTSTNGGDGSGGNAGTGTNGGDGGTSGSGADMGGTSTGGASEGGTTGTGGDAGSATGGTGGDAGTAGMSGSAGKGGSGGTPSAGCRAGGSPASGRMTIDVSGTMREYIIKLPASYDNAHPYRLMLTLHGRMYSAQTVADGGPPGSGPYYGIEAVSGGTTIFVAPQALSTSWTNESGRDTAYIDAMVARFKSELCIDESRMFITGFSMGAIMTLTYACAKPATFRAIAPMSASLPSTCTGTTPIAYWGSHGTNDPTISYASGQAVRDSFVARNGCTMQTMPGDQDGCVSYQGCDAPVNFCTFDGVHQPPPYAGVELWAFFSQF